MGLTRNLGDLKALPSPGYTGLSVVVVEVEDICRCGKNLGCGVTTYTFSLVFGEIDTLAFRQSSSGSSSTISILYRGLLVVVVVLLVGVVDGCVGAACVVVVNFRTSWLSYTS